MHYNCYIKCILFLWIKKVFVVILLDYQRSNINQYYIEFGSALIYGKEKQIFYLIFLFQDVSIIKIIYCKQV